MDISRPELDEAPAGSYDEIVVADITEHKPELTESFDLIISWQVMEHVKPLQSAFDNMHTYLRLDGQAVLFFSGAFSVFALANRLLPDGVGQRVVARIMHRDPVTVFPALYDQCHPRGLRRVLAKWSASEIVPTWGGAAYFSAFRPAQRAYTRYESWAQRKQHDTLATHYLVSATK